MIRHAPLAATTLLVCALSVLGAWVVYVGLWWVQNPLAQCCFVGAGSLFFAAASGAVKATREPS